MKKKEWRELLFGIFFVVLIIVGFLLTIRKIYWDRKLKEGREETRKLMEEDKKFSREQHTKHIKAGIKYHKNCNICRGLY